MSRCTAQTTKGRQCKQKAVEGFEYCPRHKETHVDLVAEMEAVTAANQAREEMLKKRIEKLEQLLIKANDKAKADNAARRELAQHRARQMQEGGGGSEDGDRYRWLMVWLLVAVSGGMW